MGKNSLFTTQLYAVNNSKLEFVLVEIYNGTHIDMKQLYQRTNWESHHNIVFYNSKLSHETRSYINLGTIPVFNLPNMKEDCLLSEMNMVINVIDELINSYCY